MKRRRSLLAALVNREVEIAEIIIKTFSLRLLLILTVPLFHEYYTGLVDDASRPWHLIVIVLMSIVTWLYGFIYGKKRWRRVGLGFSMFLHTFMMFGMFRLDPYNGIWMVYAILSIFSILVFSRLKTEG